jgi:hypothetical protein
MIGALMLSGDTASHALARALKGEENVLYASWNRKPGLGSRAIALVAGAPAGLVYLTEFHGFNGVLANLRGGPGRLLAIETLGLFGLGVALVVAAGISAVRRRDGALLFAFGVMMLLPVVRSGQYGYLKFYIFMAVIAAFAAVRARPALVASAAVALVLANAGPIVLSLKPARRDYREDSKVYARAGAQSCWVTTAWIPRFNFRWPGQVCGVLAQLASGHGQTEAEVEDMARASLTACLDQCFCRSSGVYFDEMSESAEPWLTLLAKQFRYTTFDLEQLMLPAARAERVSEADGPPIYRYPTADQRRICEGLTRARAATP